MSDLDVESKFPDLRPMKRPPWLATVNGCGCTLAGARDFDEETGTYVKTYCLCLVFIPVFALAAYRVADAQRGWYFLGRVPVSAFARGWNCLFVLALLGLGGYLGWNHYTRSPEYLARQQVIEADRLAGDGHLGRAAQRYGEVARGTTGLAPAAAERLKALCTGPVDQAEPAEAAAAFKAAAESKSRLGPVDDLFKHGLQVVHQHAAADPKGALLVADALLPLAPKPEDLTTKRQALLERVVTLEPANPEPASQLAVIYEAQREDAKCEALLPPHIDRLGLSEGARILGQVFVRQGKFEQAHGLLGPYVEGRLKRLHAAEKTYQDTFKAAEERCLDSLRSGKAKDFSSEKYKAANKVQQQALVEEYLQDRLKDDSSIQAAQDAVAREAGVVPVALDFGIVLLRRAQTLADPAARRAELEKAEKTFLAVRSLAGETNQYRLFLGQVYYWLGKHAEGRKLFDDLLTAQNRAVETLRGVSRLLREVGAYSEARTLIEEAYQKETDPAQKYQAAHDRSLLGIDLDDQIAWLGRCDPADQSVKASLAMARGNKALREGKEDDAARHLRGSIELYDRLRVSAASLNNGALAYLSLFRVTGDREALNQGLARIDKAVALQPSDSILLGNAASRVLEGACRDLIGNTIDLKTLKEEGNLDLLNYLYLDQTGKDRLVERLRAHPGLAKAIAYYERFTVLAPKTPRGYEVLLEIYRLMGDRDKLRDLSHRLKGLDLDLADATQRTLEYYAGKKDAQYKQDLAAAVQRHQKLLAAARQARGATLAVAAIELVRTHLSAAALGQPVDANALVALAEEAHAAAPSSATHGYLLTTLLFRAHQAALRQDPSYAALAARVQRSLPPAYLMAVALERDGNFRARMVRHPDFQRVLGLIKEALARFPADVDPWSWAMLRTVQPEDAADVARKVAQNELDRLERSIGLRLNPASPGHAFCSYWALQMEGKEAEGRALLKTCGARGVPMPFEVN